MQWLRSLATFAALAVALLFWVEDADARLEGGPSLSQGTEGTLLSPPVAAPALAVIAANDHVTAGSSSYPGGSLGGLFNRPGLLGGFAAGFLGSGVLGLLFGHGLVGELGSMASVLGLVFQLALIALLCRLIWTWWSGRNAPAFAGLSPRQLADPYLRSRHEFLPDVEPPSDADDVAADNHRAVSK
jgi:predicted lipid-binding transport protein (Tim44 family)